MVFLCLAAAVFILDHFIKSYVDAHCPQGFHKEVFGGRLILRTPTGPLNCSKAGNGWGRHFRPVRCSVSPGICSGCSFLRGGNWKKWVWVWLWAAG